MMTFVSNEQILNAFSFRHACKAFDPERKISEEDFLTILEAARLSPSSLGLEPWKFIVVQNQALREQLKAFAWGAQTQLPTASHIVIALQKVGPQLRYDGALMEQDFFNRRPLDATLKAKYRKNIRQFQEVDFDLLSSPRALDDWAGKQTYIALGNMLTAAALKGIDSCPVEGFNIGEMNDFLKEHLTIDMQHYSAVYMLAFGYRAKTEQPKKIRHSQQDIVTWMA